MSLGLNTVNTVVEEEVYATKTISLQWLSASAISAQKRSNSHNLSGRPGSQAEMVLKKPTLQIYFKASSLVQGLAI